MKTVVYRSFAAIDRARENGHLTHEEAERLKTKLAGSTKKEVYHDVVPRIRRDEAWH